MIQKACLPYVRVELAMFNIFLFLYGCGKVKSEAISFSGKRCTMTELMGDCEICAFVQKVHPNLERV